VDYIPLAEFAYNNSRQVSIKSSPFQILYGIDPRVITLDLHMGGEVSREVKDRATYIKEIRETACESIAKAQEQQAKQYNAKRREKTFRVGEYVWITNKNWSRIRPNKKLDQL
jgi:hypothetical protein